MKILVLLHLINASSPATPVWMQHGNKVFCGVYCVWFCIMVSILVSDVSRENIRWLFKI